MLQLAREETSGHLECSPSRIKSRSGAGIEGRMESYSAVPGVSDAKAEMLSPFPRYNGVVSCSASDGASCSCSNRRKHCAESGGAVPPSTS